MRIIVELESGDTGISEVKGDEDVSHALDVFSRALVGAWFGFYQFKIAEDHDDERTDEVLSGTCCENDCGCPASGRGNDAYLFEGEVHTPEELA